MPNGHADALKVAYQASDFPPHLGLNGSGRLKVDWQDVLWASITVGKSPRDIFRYGAHSAAEMIHRIACFEAYYDIEDEWLTITPAFRHLDPTEKGIVSFYTGMAMAKLFADKVLGVPWLMHISRYSTPWAVRYGARTDRPDLFGCNVQGDWVVAEAKGRSRVTGALIAKMKEQKSAVATINGLPPLHRFGSATRIEARRLSLRVVDPPASARAQDLVIDPAAWLVDYYEPVVDLMEATTTRREDGVVFGRLPGSQVEVGLPEEMIDVVRQSRERQFSRPQPRVRQADREPHERRALTDQAEPTNRDIVERLGLAAQRARGFADRFADGVIVRAPRG